MLVYRIASNNGNEPAITTTAAPYSGLLLSITVAVPAPATAGKGDHRGSPSTLSVAASRLDHVSVGADDCSKLKLVDTLSDIHCTRKPANNTYEHAHIRVYTS